MGRFDTAIDRANGSAGFVSVLNSTETPLGSGATFTGAYEDVAPYSRMYLTLEGTTSAATGTLYIDFSADKVNADFTKTYTITDITAFQTRTLVLSRKWFRVRYVNDATAQTTFRLHVKINADGPQLVRPANGTLLTDEDTLVVRQSNDLALDLARSLQTGIASVNKFGRNGSVGTSEEYVTIGGGTTYAGFLTAASAVRIKAGGNAADTAAGAGARTVTVVGLDENWAEASETVTTAGASASSATSTTFIRVFRATVATCGTYGGSNTGAITIETTGGAELLQIAADHGQSEHALYTVPAGKTAYLVQYSFIVSGGKPATCWGKIRLNADDSTGDVSPFLRVVEVPELDGTFQSSARVYDAFPAKTDLVASAASATGTTAVNARFVLYLVDN